MGYFGAAHGWKRGTGRGGEAPLPKFCHSYPTMTKLGTVMPYLNEIQNICELRDTPLAFCGHQHFFTENQ